MHTTNRMMVERMLAARAAGAARDESKEEAVRWRATTDLYWFGASFLGLGSAKDPDTGRFYTDPVLHRDLSRNLESPESILIMLPRNHAKSTWVSLWCAQQVLAHPDTIHILLISLDRGVSKKNLAQVAIYLAQPQVLKYFPDIVPAPGTRFQHWTVKNTSELTVLKRAGRVVPENQITATSFDSTITGHHFSHIVADDVIDHKSVRTAQRRKESAERVGQLKSILAPAGRFLFVGTRYHLFDLYQTIREAKLVKKEVIRQATELPPVAGGPGKRKRLKARGAAPEGVKPGSLEDPRSKPIYCRYTKADLRSIRDELHGLNGNHSEFLAQYYNNPTSQDTLVFPSPIRTYKERAENLVTKAYIALDTANEAGDQSDPQGLACVLIDEADYIYVEECVEVRGTWEDALTATIRMALRYRDTLQAIAIECHNEDNILAAYHRCLHDFYNLYSSPVSDLPYPQVVRPFGRGNYDASKTERINAAFGSPYRMGWATPKGSLTKLIEQMGDFPKSKNDDLVDAVSIAISIAKPSLTGAILSIAPPSDRAVKQLVSDYFSGLDQPQADYEWGEYVAD